MNCIFDSLLYRIKSTEQLYSRHTQKFYSLARQAIEYHNALSHDADDRN
jgi:hypothetical protein